MLQKILTAAAVSLLVSLPVSADLYYKAKSWQEGDQAAKEAQMTVEAYIDGERADIRFVESGNPLMGQGDRLITKDGGREVFLVDDEERTVSPWDLEAVFEMASNLMEGLGPMVNFKIENAKVESLLEEAGGQVAGYDTTHYRYRTEYDLTFKIMGMGSKQRVETVQDVWSTTQLDAAALSVWLSREPPDFGDSGFGELIALEQSKIKGFPLKTVTEQVTTGKKGKNQATTRTYNEVLLIDERSAPSGAYSWPPDYQVVNRMPVAEGLQAGEADEDELEEGDEEEEKKGWRSRLPFGKKKGGE